MTSFLSDFVSNIKESWSEVDLLIKKAKEFKDSDQDFHNSLCRAITILNIANLENFIKSLIKSIIHDLNYNLDFQKRPTSIQRTYCSSFLSVDKQGNINERKLNKLMQKFGDLDVTIEHEVFFHDKFSNPNPETMKYIFNNIGITKLFNYLNQSEHELIFSEIDSEIIKYTKKVKRNTLRYVKTFPYKVIKQTYNIGKNTTDDKTIWEDFLENINNTRHSIAHGADYNNLKSIDELEKEKRKIIILQFALIQIAAYKIIEQVANVS